MFPQIHLIIRNAIGTLRNELKTYVAGELALAGSAEILSGMIVPYAGQLVGPGQKHPLNTRTGMPDLSYALCDGGYYTAPDGKSVLTPNLIGRFLRGAAIGDQWITGGNSVHSHAAWTGDRTLSYDQLPYHNHAQKGPDPQSQGEAYLHYRKGNSQVKEAYLSMSVQTLNTTAPIGTPYGKEYLYTAVAGASNPHNHVTGVAATDTLPPYMQLYYIMKL